MAVTLNASTSAGFVQTADTSGVLQLQTANTTAVTIDASQNVGVGVTPSAWSGIFNAIQGAYGGCIAFQNNGPGTKVGNNWYYNGTNYIYTTTNAAARYDLSDSHKWYIAPSGTAGNAITFTQAMTLDASGNLGIGTTSPAALLHLKGSSNPALYFENSTYGSSKNAIFMSSSGAFVFGRAGVADWATIDSSGYLLVGYASSNGAYKLQVNSQIFATSSTIATSDERYKENVETLNGALAVVNALRPVQFSWKQHPVHAFDTETPTVGFLAQEVQQVLAEKPYLNSIVKKNETKLPDGEKEEFLGIAEGNLIAILTAAIQEQQALIQTLTARIEALEGAK